MKALFFLADDRRRVLLITGTALLLPPMFVVLLPAMVGAIADARSRNLLTFSKGLLQNQKIDGLVPFKVIPSSSFGEGLAPTDERVPRFGGGETSQRPGGAVDFDTGFVKLPVMSNLNDLRWGKGFVFACRRRSPDSSADVVIRANFVVEGRGGRRGNAAFSHLVVYFGIPKFLPSNE